jgi:acetyltransferase-like isoleucine patch superfamily enzyme
MYKKISRLLKLILMRIDKSVNQNYFVHPTAIFNVKSNVIIGDGSHVNEYVIFRTPITKLVIGKNTHIGPFSVIFTATYGINIGNYVMIAPNCVLVEGAHVTDNLSLPMLLAGDFSKGPIIIEDDVWIGANCTILHNVRIGKGAVIGANSLVNKNVEPYTIVGGVPIKQIGSRLN